MAETVPFPVDWTALIIGIVSIIFVFCLDRWRMIQRRREKRLDIIRSALSEMRQHLLGACEYIKSDKSDALVVNLNSVYFSYDHMKSNADDIVLEKEAKPIREDLDRFHETFDDIRANTKIEIKKYTTPPDGDEDKLFLDKYNKNVASNEIILELVPRLRKNIEELLKKY